jgi:ribonuclease-3
MNHFKKNQTYSDNSSISSNEDRIVFEEPEKKIYPVYNETNCYVTKDIIQKILKSANITNEISNLNVFQQAFVHKSYYEQNDFKKNEKFFGSIESIDISKNNHLMPLQKDTNEVLEWTGDGVLQHIVALYLSERYPTQREGFLTKIRSKLVRTETLSKLALSLGFDKYLIISKHVEIICCGRKNSRILEDCFEAFIGAMTKDFGKNDIAAGFKVCYDFVINIIEKNVDMTELIMNDDNFKDQLMRYYQKQFNGKFPKYEQKTIITTIGDNGIASKKFHMFVRDVENNIIGEGIARSKKEAEQKAAKAALMHFGISNGY